MAKPKKNEEAAQEESPKIDIVQDEQVKEQSEEAAQEESPSDQSEEEPKKELTKNEALAKTLKPRYHLVNVPNGDGWKQISKEDFTDVDAFAILEFWDTLENFDKEKAIKSIFE